ncbi:MAG: choice-of-anchor Q domain-containing protein, partial [Solirubrobacterales bacterium]
VTPGTRIYLATGTYAVTTGLNLTVENTALIGEGEAADTVINSSGDGMYNTPALTVSGGSEASKFSINASGQFSKGLNVVDGQVDHLAVTAGGSDACTGVDATIVESLCRATGATVFGAGFQKAAGSGSHSFLFSNSTFIASEGWYGASIEAHGSSSFQVAVNSSIIFGAGQTHLILSGANSQINFVANYSNYGQIRRKLDGNEQTPEPPTGTNQPLESYPLFTDFSSDFTQAPGSPTINAGEVNGLSGDTDLAGNPRVQGGVPDIGAYESDYVPPVVTPPTGGGNLITPPVLDTLKPTLTISKKPKSKTTSTKLKVVFKASETASFQCKLDKGKFKTCKSPYKKTVKRGKHKLQIKATDAAGNVSSVKTIKWTVKVP